MALSGNFKQFWAAHGTKVMTTGAIAGLVTTTYFTADATLKASQLIAEKENDLTWDTIETKEPRTELDTQEKFDLVWRLYIPAGVSFVATLGCILTLHRTGVQQTAAATAMYTMTEHAYSNYRKKVAENIGEKKEEGIRDDIAADVVANTPVPEPGGVINTGQGMVLCMDAVSGRYFYSSVEAIRRAENDINRRLIQEMAISLSEFYDLLGLDNTSISDDIGWCSDDMLDVHISSTLTSDDKPCVYIDYDAKPMVVISRTY